MAGVKFTGWESAKHKLGEVFKVPTPFLAFTPRLFEENGEAFVTISTVVNVAASDSVTVKAYKHTVDFDFPFELPNERLHAVPKIDLEARKIEWFIIEVIPPERHGIRVLPPAKG